MSPFRKAVALILALYMTGCGWKVTPQPRPPSPPSRLVVERALLKVDASAVARGGSGMGETVRETLVADGTFRELYYPIEPRDPPSMTLAIVARGTVDEHEGAGLVKSVVIGLLLFLPVGVIRFDKTLHLDADVFLRDHGTDVAHFQVSNATDISFTMFSTMEDYEQAARTAAFKDLGEQVAARLSPFSTKPTAP